LVVVISGAYGVCVAFDDYCVAVVLDRVAHHFSPVLVSDGNQPFR
jgi:hypothetical protein